jgi:glycosyltransferase involved in cell wall biosynthesis
VVKARRILVAHPFPDLYGSDRSLLRTLSALRGEGSEILVVVPERGPLIARLADEGVPTRIMSFPVLRKSALSPAGLGRLAAGTVSGTARIARLMRSFRADIVYVNTLTLPHWLIVARLLGIPSVCHVREAEEGISPFVAAALVMPVTAATAVVANSDATARFLASRYPRLAERTTVIWNGFDFPPATQPPARNGQRPVRLAVVGRLNARKGQDVAIRAVQLLRASGGDVWLDIVGSTFRGYEWYERELRELAQSLGLSDCVRFTGFLDPPWPAYENADIVLVPSRTEPFGNVAVEAMSLSRPVVASRVGGLPEIVDDGRTGLLVEPDEPESLARAIEELLMDPAAAARIGTEAAASVRERFRLDRYVRDVVAVLDGLPTK